MQTKIESEEYYAVQSAIAHCGIACLWHDDCPEATSMTYEHIILARRTPDGKVIIEVKRK